MPKDVNIIKSDKRKTSLLSTVTETINPQDLEVFQEQIIELIGEFLSHILTSTPIKGEFNSEMNILFSWRPARVEFANMIFQEKFKKVNFANLE